MSLAHRDYLAALFMRFQAAVERFALMPMIGSVQKRSSAFRSLATSGWWLLQDPTSNRVAPGIVTAVAALCDFAEC